MNIYIRNLAFKTTDSSLEKAFSNYGEVSSAKVITDKMSGKSRGFGFVEMPDDEAANQAIRELNGTNLDGRDIQVSESKPKN